MRPWRWVHGSTRLRSSVGGGAVAGADCTGRCGGRGYASRAVRQRNLVERLIKRCKQSRREATRYEEVGGDCLAMAVIAALLLWL